VISPNGDNVIRTVSTAETPLRDLRQVATGVEFETGLARAHRMVDTLLAVANATSSLLDPAKLFNTVLNYLFDVIPDAARGFVMTLDEVDQLRPAAIRVRQDRGSGGSLSLAQGVVNRVLRQGKAVLCDPAEGWKHHKRVASTISAPLMVRGKILGIIHIEGCESGQPFDKEDLDLLSGIAMQVGVAYHNASLHQRLMRQQRLEQDLRFARRVQHSFLPSEPPEVPGFLFSRSYNPVFQVGGDLYDFIPLPDERIGVLIGDVAGKGVSAALMMARLTSDMRYFAISESSPARVLDRANTSMFTHMQDNMFVTLLYLVLDVPGRSMTLCNAGHIPPLIRRAGNGHVAELDEATNLALGVLPDPTFDEVTLQLELGDSVLLTTDGVVEAKSRAGEEFGFDRLRHALSSATAKRLLDTVLADVQGYTEGTAQYDDITMVAFTRTE
jgi:serine phosphatase RsbU (regulator of sigma subunit)